MPLDPSVQAVLEQIAQLNGPKTHELPVADARQVYEAFAAMCGPVVEMASVVDDKIDGPAGPIPIRIYTPAGDGGGDAGRPVVLYLHGGGWTIGSIASHDAVCRLLADGAGAVVVSSEYRLGPEHRYPAALDDARAALGWVAAHASDIDADPARLAVAGDSAGGNLAAALCLDARDAGGPPIRFQLLVYPVLDLTFGFPSYEENGEGYLLERGTMKWFRANYVGDDPVVDLKAPLLSPLHAPDLSGLPPALVITAEFDVLRDEGEAYARRLTEAGVDAHASRYDGMVHGFFGMGPIWPKAADAMAECTAALRAALSP